MNIDRAVVEHALQHARVAAQLLMDAHAARPETWLGFYDDALVHADIAIKDLENLRAALQSQAAKPTTFLKERAQLEQEWSILREMQEQYKDPPPDTQARERALVVEAYRAGRDTCSTYSHDPSPEQIAQIINQKEYPQ